MDMYTMSVKCYAISPKNKGYSNDKWDFGFLQEAFTKNNVDDPSKQIAKIGKGVCCCSRI